MTNAVESAQEQRRPSRKERVGTVVSAKMRKTIVVEVERRFRHPEFRKVVTRSKKLYAHDESGSAQVGDRVRIVETRPLSKLKNWRLVEVVERGLRSESAGLPQEGV